MLPAGQSLHIAVRRLIQRQQLQSTTSGTLKAMIQLNSRQHGYTLLSGRPTSQLAWEKMSLLTPAHEPKRSQSTEDAVSVVLPRCPVASSTGRYAYLA